MREESERQLAVPSGQGFLSFNMTLDKKESYIQPFLKRYFLMN